MLTENVMIYTTEQAEKTTGRKPIDITANEGTDAIDGRLMKGIRSSAILRRLELLAVSVSIWLKPGDYQRINLVTATATVMFFCRL